MKIDARGMKNEDHQNPNTLLLDCIAKLFFVHKSSYTAIIEPLRGNTIYLSLGVDHLTENKRIKLDLTDIQVNVLVNNFKNLLVKENNEVRGAHPVL